MRRTHDVAFGMGSAFRSSVVAGLTTDAVEFVPSVPPMFGWYFPDAAEILAEPARPRDRRRRPEPHGADRQAIRHHRDRPAAAHRGLRHSVISSLEYYQAGHDRLNPGGIMMQWVPYGQTIDEFRAHVRTFADAFPEVLVLRSPGNYGFFVLGSDQPMALEDRNVREVLARPGHPRGHLGGVRLSAKTADGGRLHSEPVLVEGCAGRVVCGLWSARHGRPSAARVLPAPPHVRREVSAGQPTEPRRRRVPVALYRDGLTTACPCEAPRPPRPRPPPDGPSGADRTDFQRLLNGLEAIRRLHQAQEEEYLSETTAPRRPNELPPVNARPALSRGSRRPHAEQLVNTASDVNEFVGR